MMRSARVLVLLLCVEICFIAVSFAADASGQWKITSVRLCRHSSGALAHVIEVIGQFPVYTFFIPRPVWTVNGSVVEAQPSYEKGRLVSFKLLDAAQHLKSGSNNTVKFSLPDHNGSKVFQFDQSRPAAGECYEFF
jgi:hypothetical protein